MRLVQRRHMPESDCIPFLFVFVWRVSVSNLLKTVSRDENRNKITSFMRNLCGKVPTPLLREREQGYVQDSFWDLVNPLEMQHSSCGEPWKTLFLPLWKCQPWFSTKPSAVFAQRLALSASLSLNSFWISNNLNCPGHVFICLIFREHAWSTSRSSSTASHRGEGRGTQTTEMLNFKKGRNRSLLRLLVVHSLHDTLMEIACEHQSHSSTAYWVSETCSTSTKFVKSAFHLQWAPRLVGLWQQTVGLFKDINHQTNPVDWSVVRTQLQMRENCGLVILFW